MNKAPKMNVLYKIAFILMLVCLALFAAAVVVLLLFENRNIGVLIAVAGVVLCMVAIILTMFSKPKQPKAKNSPKELKEADTEHLEGLQ